MRTSDKGIIALIAHEGIVPGPYRDSKGIWTWGVGHTAAAGEPIPANKPRGMPDDLDAALVEVFKVFRRDLARYEAGVREAFTAELTQEQFDAAVSFHFNTGAVGRASWVRTFNSGHVAEAAKQIMNWSKPPEIISRRMAEQKLFRDGVYPDAPLAVWRVTDAGKVVFKPERMIKPDEALALMRGGVRPDEEIPETPPAKSWLAKIIETILRMIK